MIGVSGSLIWSKTTMELIFNYWGEVRRAQLAKSTPHIHVGAPGIFSDLLRSVQMLKRERDAERTESYRTYSSLVKLQAYAQVSGNLSNVWRGIPPSSSLAWQPIMGPGLAQKLLPFVSIHNKPCSISFPNCNILRDAVLPSSFRSSHQVLL